MFDKIIDILKPIARVATVFTGGNPVVAGISAALEIIDKVEDADDDTRTEMYVELAEGLGTVSGIIIEAIRDDGKVTEDEHKEIVKALQELAQDLG